MEFESLVFNCLLEGLPLRLLQIFLENPSGLTNLKEYNFALYELVEPYLRDRDLVALYSRASLFSFKKKNIPIFHHETDIKKLFSDMMQTYERTELDDLNFQQGQYVPFGHICKTLNPMPGRETYVLKRPSHSWMYEDILSKFKINSLLEIGIFYGGSTHAWRLRLPDVKLYSLDINEPLQDSKILERCQSLFVKGSAVNISDIKKVCINSPFDLVIDDASHLVPHQIFTFLLFIIEKACRKIYIIEDIDLLDRGRLSFMDFFQSLIHFQSTFNDDIFIQELQKFVTEDTHNIFTQIVNNLESLKSIHKCKMTFYGDSLCIHM